MNNTVLPDEKRFDFSRKVKPMSALLRPVAWALSCPEVLANGSVITKIGMEGIKPPYLLLVNHNCFYDFKVVTTALFPHRYNNVVAIDGFTGREWLLRSVGCICKRKFTNDISLIRQILRVMKNGDILALYPEARYSLCGTEAVLPKSLPKLIKMLGVPVVLMINHGHHLMSPFWNLRKRKVRTESVMTCLIRREELPELSADEIAGRLEANFRYDDFAWQKETGRRITENFRAEKLHKVLYKCPACGEEYTMDSKGCELFCKSCGKRWYMTELGELSAQDGNTEFSHIPSWYEWERECVRAEIEKGSYRFEGRVKVMALPNAEKFRDAGYAVLVHDMNGFTLTGQDYCIKQPPLSTYSVHIEYEYLGKYGDCIDINTKDDTLYVYPEGEDFSVTKIALATEELYKHFKGDDSLLCVRKSK